LKNIIHALFFAMCLLTIPQMVESQSQPDWIRNPPFSMDTAHLVFRNGFWHDFSSGRSLYLEEADGSITVHVQVEMIIGVNQVVVGSIAEDGWFISNARLHNEFHGENGEVYQLYSFQWSILNILFDNLLEALYTHTPTFRPNTLENAIFLSASQLVFGLPENSRVALLGFETTDNELREFVLGEMTAYLYSSGTLSVLARLGLDIIDSEHDFQMSGEVDDNTAVSIGQFAGADVVITGDIIGSGSTRRMRFTALDVRTARILVQTSNRF